MIKKENFIKLINRKKPNIKIKIVAERRDGKRIEIPISKYTIFELADFSYYDGDMFEDVKKDLSDFWAKIEFLEHDVINDGECTEWNEKKNKWAASKIKHYLYKKPKWKKNQNGIKRKNTSNS